MSKLRITICPTCGSKNIRKLRGIVRGTYQGKQYSVPGVEFHECPDCGEVVYDPAAIKEIEKHSPAFMKRKSARKIA